LGSVSSFVSEKKIFEISANQSILLALAAMLNIRLERKTDHKCSLDGPLQTLGILFRYEIQNGGYGRT
jgi:hypothetical protein